MRARRDPGGRGAAIGAAALVLAVASGAPRAVRADPMPTGRVSGQAGIKAATGSFASRLGVGYAFGFEAAYQPLRPDQSIGVALSWFTTWSHFGEGSARVAGSLAMLELGAGARLRAPLGVRRRQVIFLGGGLGLIRLNEPVVEDGDRSYVGWWANGGIEGVLFGAQVGLEARYVVTRTDDGTIAFLLSVGFGS
jgi:hypothetical protein